MAKLSIFTDCGLTKRTALDMAKYVTIVIAVFFFLNANSQDFANTEWIKVKGTREDGSKIISQDSSAPLSFFFLNDSVFVGLSHQYIYKNVYSVRNSILSIDKRTKYHIDSVDDAFLIISQLTSKNLSDDGLNKYTFIKSDYLFDYLKQNEQLNMSGDSIVICNHQFSPTYIGDANTIVLRELPYINGEQSIKGSFVITPNGSVIHVQIDTAVKFSNKEIEKVKTALYQTRGSWILPPTPVPLQFKMTFNFKSYYSSNFLLFTAFQLLPDYVHHGLNSEQKQERSLSDMEKAQRHGSEKSRNVMRRIL